MGHFKITIRGISKEKETLILALTAGKPDSKIDGPLSKQTPHDQLSAAFLFSVMSICISKWPELSLPDCSWALLFTGNSRPPVVPRTRLMLDPGPLFMHFLQLGKSLPYSTKALTLGSSAKSLWPQPQCSSWERPYMHLCYWICHTVLKMIYLHICVASAQAWQWTLSP